MDKIWKIGIPAILAIGFIMFVMAFSPTENPLEKDKSEGITLNTLYHATLYRPGEGIIYEADVHNLITNDGKDLVRDKMRGASTINVSYMGLADYDVAPAATDSDLTDEHVANGLARALGIYNENQGNGNWSISYKWTATGSADVGLFGVFNMSWPSNVSMFSTGNFSGAGNVSMLANDELTVNVTYTVS